MIKFTFPVRGVPVEFEAEFSTRVQLVSTEELKTLDLTEPELELICGAGLNIYALDVLKGEGYVN